MALIAIYNTVALFETQLGPAAQMHTFLLSTTFLCHQIWISCLGFYITFFKVTACILYLLPCVTSKVQESGEGNRDIIQLMNSSSLHCHFNRLTLL